MMRANRAAVARAAGVGGMEIYIVNPGIAGDAKSIIALCFVWILGVAGLFIWENKSD